jgi:hypothetical protein
MVLSKNEQTLYGMGDMVNNEINSYLIIGINAVDGSINWYLEGYEKYNVIPYMDVLTNGTTTSIVGCTNDLISLVQAIYEDN